MLSENDKGPSLRTNMIRPQIRPPVCPKGKLYTLFFLTFSFPNSLSNNTRFMKKLQQQNDLLSENDKGPSLRTNMIRPQIRPRVCPKDTLYTLFCLTFPFPNSLSNNTRFMKKLQQQNDLLSQNDKGPSLRTTEDDYWEIKFKLYSRFWVFKKKLCENKSIFCLNSGSGGVKGRVKLLCKFICISPWRSKASLI